MTTIPQRYLHTIQQAYRHGVPPRLRFNQEGLVNDVVIVDDERVFRFPKHDWAKDALRHEARVLDLVRRHVTVTVPAFETLEDDVATYRYLRGAPLTRTLLLRQAPAVRATLLAEVVRFVQELHAIPTAAAEAAGIGPSDTNRERAWWSTFHRDLQQHVIPSLMNHQKAFIDDLFGPFHSGELDFEHEPRLVHGDLAPYHLLVDQERGRLAAVLDFGTAGLGDPAVDIACLLHAFGESLIVPLMPSLARDEALLNRARFWAATLDLQVTLGGLLRDDKTLLLAHVGSAARDLLPPAHHARAARGQGRKR